MEIREILQEKLKLQEKENKLSHPALSPILVETKKNKSPPAVPRKGILKTTARKARGDVNTLKSVDEESEYPDDRVLPHVPLINLEDDDCSSSSSTPTSSLSSSVSAVDNAPSLIPQPAASRQRTLRSNVTERRRRL